MHETNPIAPTPAQVIARARALVPVLAERAAAGEEARRLPRETIADMQAAGFQRGGAPMIRCGEANCKFVPMACHGIAS
jgi:hypothetical protein